jgi:hypothetical protein
MTGCMRRAPSSPRQGLMMHFMSGEPSGCEGKTRHFIAEWYEGFTSLFQECFYVFMNWRYAHVHL